MRARKRIAITKNLKIDLGKNVVLWHGGKRTRGCNIARINGPGKTPQLLCQLTDMHISQHAGADVKFILTAGGSPLSLGETLHRKLQTSCGFCVEQSQGNESA